ncbi:MAG: hypothetical protein HEP71_32130 [Roseivirga sp.]|nr:hypothetical protein [Roseivirga sp.]
MGFFDLFNKKDRTEEKTVVPLSQDQIALAVKVFETYPSQGQKGICDLIGKKTGRADLASDLYRFIPIAYGRLIVQEVSYPDRYLVEKKGDIAEYAFSENTLYVQVEQYITRKIRKPPSQIDMLNVLNHSPEFDAINQALHAGSKLEDLVLSPPYFLE